MRVGSVLGELGQPAVCHLEAGAIGLGSTTTHRPDRVIPIPTTS